MRLLDYFGEAAAPCGNCDNCLDRPEEWDGTGCGAEAALLYRALQVGDRVQLRRPAHHRRPRGNRTAKVEQFHHERLSTFGIGADLDAARWRSVLRQLVMLRLIQVDTDRYSVLRLAPACREVLRGERTGRLRLVSDRRGSVRAGRGRVDRSRVTRPPADDTIHSGSLWALRAWRRQVAREHGVPAYTVFHDTTLEEIARRRPGSTVELSEVSGVGVIKLERYGAAVLDLVQTGPPGLLRPQQSLSGLAWPLSGKIELSSARSGTSS